MASFLKKYLKKSRFELKEATQLYFLKRLHRLLTNGYSILSALNVLQWDKELRQSAKVMTKVLKNGQPLDRAFEHANFHNTIVAYLYFVRINGNLLASLENCITMFEHRVTYIKKFSQVIRYPLVLGFTFIILLIFLKRSVLPSFTELFQMSTTSSKTVHYSIIAIDFMSTLFFIIIAALMIATIVWYFIKTKLTIERQIHFYEKIPFLRSFIRIQTSYFFSIHMSMFLKAGLPIKDTLTNMGRQDKLPIVAHYSALMAEKLSSGFFIDHLLLSLPFIDKQLALIFQQNNNMNTLAKDLTTYADFLTNYLERIMMRVITLIQPVFFIILACFIILIYVSLMWPMFQLIQSV